MLVGGGQAARRGLRRLLCTAPGPKGLCGIDEAGRGAALGPLVVAGVVVGHDTLDMWKKQGVRDSKQLSPRRREYLVQAIRESCISWCTVHVSAEEIDQHRAQGLSMNDLELAATARIADQLKGDASEIHVDSYDGGDENRPARAIASMLQLEVPIRAAHHMDANCVAVAAASIVAKSERDAAMEELRRMYGQELGTGYTFDKSTVAWLERFFEDPVMRDRPPPFVRTSWITLRRKGVRVRGAAET